MRCRATILGDWGSTRLRLWLAGSSRNVIASKASDRGALNLQAQGFAEVFLNLTSAWRSSYEIESAYLCGMVGRRGGWAEAPYLTVDQMGDLSTQLTWVSAGGIGIALLPGLKSVDPDDVMRGEETLLLGFLQETPNFSGTVCLPGTHSKWCVFRNGGLTGIRTEMTGEIFALLSNNSSLRDAVCPSEDRSAFDQGVFEGFKMPAILSRLFGIRASWLLRDIAPEVGYGRLSGMLIGSELARMSAECNVNGTIFIGSSELVTRYTQAAKLLGFACASRSGEDLALAGLLKVADATRNMVDG